MLLRIGLEIASVIAVALALDVAQKDGATPGRRTFIALALASLAWSVGELLLLRGPIDLATYDRIRLAGILALPALWLGVAAHAVGFEVARRVPWFSALFILPGACFYPLLYSTRWGSLFVQTLPDGGSRIGPLWEFWVVYAQLLTAAGCLLLILAALRAAFWRLRVRRMLVGLAPLLLGAVGGLHAAAGPAWPADPTPILLGLILLGLRSAVFPGGVLQALPISQRDLVHQLPFGVILVDHDGTVVEINSAASARLKASGQQVLGHTLGKVLSATGVAPLRSATLRRWGRSVGEIVLV
jgi:PAS domain-containing protein